MSSLSIILTLLPLLYSSTAQVTNCYDADTFCSNAWSYSPSDCIPDLSTTLPTIYTTYCYPNELILWKTGILNGPSTASHPFIDHNFIICQESFSLCGYVPLQTAQSSSTCGQVRGESGVTFGAGIDLGHQSRETLSDIGASDDILEIFDTYFGLTGTNAAEAICNQPFTINSDQAYNLSIKLMDQYANQVQIWYDEQRNLNTIPFIQLPLGIRTVLTSIHWRWGHYSSYPTFWSHILSNNFANATNELRSWYDNGATDIRLSKEANIMEASLGCTTSSGVDCVFLVDESGSVGADNFQLAKNWVVEFVEAFESNIGDNSDHGARFGTATFASGYTNEFYLHSYSNLDNYRAAIQAISYSGGSTYLGEALQYIGTTQFLEAMGMRASSKGIPRVLIVMTDGASNGNIGVVTGAASLSSLNLNIIAIGIAGYNLDQLRDITTDEYIYTLDTFTALDDILDGITTQTCFVPAQLDMNTTIEDIQAIKGQSQYFEVSPTINLDENIILNISQTHGCVYVYISYCTQYPSYFVNDIEFTSCGQPFKQIILSPLSQDSETCSNQSASIFIAFEGRGEDDGEPSTFNMEIDVCNNSVCEVGTNYDPSLDDDDPYSIDDESNEEIEPQTTFIDTITSTTINVSIFTKEDKEKEEKRDGLDGFEIALIIAFIIVLIIISAVLFMKYKMNNNRAYNKEVPMEEEQDNEDDIDDETVHITNDNR